MGKAFLVEGQITEMSGAFASRHTSDALPHAIVYDREADPAGEQYDAYIGVIFDYTREGPKISHIMLDPHTNGEGPQGYNTADIKLAGRNFRCFVVKRELDFYTLIQHAEMLNAEHGNKSMPVALVERLKEIQTNFQMASQKPITEIKPRGRGNAGDNFGKSR